MHSFAYKGVSVERGVLSMSRCQVGAERVIGDERLAWGILRALGNEYSRRILVATIREAMSAGELSLTLGIPIATVYRKINEMVESGVLVKERSRLTCKGKWVDLYRSSFKALTVVVDERGVFVSVERL